MNNPQGLSKTLLAKAKADLLARLADARYAAEWRYQLAHAELYGGQLLTVDEIADAIGVPVEQFPYTVGYAQVACRCPLCKRAYDYVATMRTEVDALPIDREHSRYSVRICDDCATRGSAPPDLRTMPYRDYLKTPHWKATRQRALERADRRCQLCGSSERLEVHHNTYANRGNEHDSDVIVLCDPCHEAFHDRRKLARD